jgi:diketogulonate reductase-like aldo/keto reductase
MDIWHFKLSDSDMEELDALDRSKEGQNTMAGWLREHDPDFY